MGTKTGLLIAGLVVVSAMVVFTGTAAADDWVSPTGHNDPIGRWSYEIYAYDDSLFNQAQCYGGGYPLYWQSFLELNIDPSITGNKLRYYIGGGTSSMLDKIDVDVYKDGSWVDVYQGSFTKNAWIEKSFAEGSVTKGASQNKCAKFMTMDR